jgi:hypothetical protein
MSNFVFLRDAAARVSGAGVPITTRGVRGWAERHPCMKLKIGGRVGIHRAALELILAGTPLPDVAAKMREQHTDPATDRAERIRPA